MLIRQAASARARYLKEIIGALREGCEKFAGEPKQFRR